MKDLRLGMNILATSTCYLDNEVFKLEPTTLVDAYESDSSHVNGLQIKLGKGHWGACPTRSRSCVAINSAEIIELANKTLVTHIENTKNDKPKHNLYFVEGNNERTISLKRMTFSRRVNSLAEGTFIEYSGRYISRKIRDENNLPIGFFYNLDEAVEYFSKVFSF
jgi:hypothetical protein